MTRLAVSSSYMSKSTNIILSINNKQPLIQAITVLVESYVDSYTKIDIRALFIEDLQAISHNLDLSSEKVAYVINLVPQSMGEFLRTMTNLNINLNLGLSEEIYGNSIALIQLPPHF